MTLTRAFVLVAFLLFGTIGIAAWQKKHASSSKAEAVNATPVAAHPIAPSKKIVDTSLWPRSANDLPYDDRVSELFNLGEPKLPFVETITYSSRVDWLKGRPAWLVDYASHYNTSRHFIARSLNKKPDYITQQVANGDLFNVYRLDIPLSFHLLVDLSRCKLWLYAADSNTHERTLIKRYDVGLGRLDPSKPSGSLTPLGIYRLGSNIATFQSGVQGLYQGSRVEMITVFGTRWIPFEKSIGICTAPPKGYGIHGTPWKHTDKDELVDEGTGIGGYESDGCLRLSQDDVEELFAIIVTKPSYIEIVKDFNDATFATDEALSTR